MPAAKSEQALRELTPSGRAQAREVARDAGTAHPGTTGTWRLLITMADSEIWMNLQYCCACLPAESGHPPRELGKLSVSQKTATHPAGEGTNGVRTCAWIGPRPQPQAALRSRTHPEQPCGSVSVLRAVGRRASCPGKGHHCGHAHRSQRWPLARRGSVDGRTGNESA
jgi:hypothetical protein